MWLKMFFADAIPIFDYMTLYYLDNSILNNMMAILSMFVNDLFETCFCELLKHVTSGKVDFVCLSFLCSIYYCKGYYIDYIDLSLSFRSK